VTRWRADAALLVTAMLWGGAFVAQREAEGVVPPLSFVAVRFAISAVALAPLAALEARRAAQPLDARSRRLAIGVALTLFVGSALQQVGLATTTATNGGFLTACYVALTPLAVWLLTGRRPRAIVAIACALAIAGAWLLASGRGPAEPLTIGDGLIVLSDFAWALCIALTPMFLALSPRPFTLAFIEYVVCFALSAAVAPVFETARVADFLAGLGPLLYAGLISGGVAFTLQIVGQRYTPPAEAALILCLESVFAAIVGAILLAERLTAVASAGCALILFSVLIVELGPPLLARLRGAAIRSPEAAPTTGSAKPELARTPH
jgi:drug/metabolite transporter (DMT)-like permease